MAQYKFDLFVVLPELDLNNTRVYEELEASPELQVEYAKALGWILPLWMIGASRNEDAAALLTRFNDTCNRVWYPLKEHPKLRSKLLAGVGLGRRVNHKFVKAATASKENDIVRLVRDLYPDSTKKEVDLWIRMNDGGAFKELVEAMGYQPAEVKDLLKTYTKMRKALCP